MTPYTMTIVYGSDDTNIASAEFKPKPPQSGTVLQFQPGDTIAVNYRGPAPGADISSSILIAGPKKKGLPQSPFDDDGNPVDLLKFPLLTIDRKSGRWGFSVSFAVDSGGNTRFYFLPDPELQVGSTGDGEP